MRNKRNSLITRECIGIRAKGNSNKEGINNLYDLIVFRNVIEHLAYPRDAIKSFIDKLKTNGVINIEVPYEPIMRENFSTHSDLVEPKKLWNEHTNFFSPKSMKSLAQNSYIKNIETKIFNYSRFIIIKNTSQTNNVYFSKK